MTPPPVRLAVLTISDTRTLAEDTSGQALVELAEADGHPVVERLLEKDDSCRIRFEVSRWVIDTGIDVAISTGGTGLTGRDGTTEAVRPLLDRERVCPVPGGPGSRAARAGVAAHRSRSTTPAAVAGDGGKDLHRGTDPGGCRHRGPPGGMQSRGGRAASGLVAQAPGSHPPARS